MGHAGALRGALMAGLLALALGSTGCATSRDFNAQEAWSWPARYIREAGQPAIPEAEGHRSLTVNPPGSVSGAWR